MIEPTYLGDGVYANIKFDGSLFLTAGSHVLEQADEVIVLEPDVLKALITYLKTNGLNYV